jgi:hypothetical protein
MFFVNNNKLTSLEFAPKKCEIFDCSRNQLTSLGFAPKECEQFNCYSNNLKTLKGAPEKCKVFNCSHNDDLVSLEFAPKNAKIISDFSKEEVEAYKNDITDSFTKDKEFKEILMRSKLNDIDFQNFY